MYFVLFCGCDVFSYGFVRRCRRVRGEALMSFEGVLERCRRPRRPSRRARARHQAPSVPLRGTSPPPIGRRGLRHRSRTQVNGMRRSRTLVRSHVKAHMKAHSNLASAPILATPFLRLACPSLFPVRFQLVLMEQVRRHSPQFSKAGCIQTKAAPARHNVRQGCQSVPRFASSGAWSGCVPMPANWRRGSPPKGDRGRLVARPSPTTWPA